MDGPMKTAKKRRPVTEVDVLLRLPFPAGHLTPETARRILGLKVPA